MTFIARRNAVLAPAVLALAALAGCAPAAPSPQAARGGLPPAPATAAPARPSSAASGRQAPVANGAVYDLLIRGGRIIDGTGSPWVRGDVAIRGDRIAAVGLMPGAQARDTIDATGLIVAPGFIDMLGHSEYPLLTNPQAASKITQGITTEITGEVTSVVPVNENTLRELGDSTRAQVTWRDLDGYFARLDAARPAINLATFVTLGSVRRYVMGDEDRRATPEELERMRGLVAGAMQQGAMGLSTGMAYSPASFTPTDEIVELAKVAGRYGGGYASHIRSEGNRLVEAVNEAIHIGEAAGTWVEVHHIKVSGKANWGKMPQAVAAIEAARARGVDVAADQYPYPASGTDLDAILPSWAHAGGTEAMLARLRDPATRARIAAELTAGGDENIGASAGGPTGVMIAGVEEDSLRKYQGMRLSEVAAARGQPVVEALFDLVLGDRSRTSAIYFSMSEPDIEYAMRQPWVSVGIDASARRADSTVTEHPHPRAYGSFPRILCRYVRERHVLTLEDAVRKFTALPAARMGLADRGVVKAGMFADLTVFDPGTVCDRATFVDPVQTAVGIQHVIVNGVPEIRDARITGARGGRGLRRGGVAVPEANTGNQRRGP
jgi:dihydroorotase/N-acyl-D-amino-acid deacylase